MSPPIPTIKAARSALEVLRKYFEGCDGVSADTFTAINNVSALIDEKRSMKQTNIENFFNTVKRIKYVKCKIKILYVLYVPDCYETTKRFSVRRGALKY
jgi:hypothetical protein